MAHHSDSLKTAKEDMMLVDYEDYDRIRAALMRLKMKLLRADMGGPDHEEKMRDRAAIFKNIANATAEFETGLWVKHSARFVAEWNAGNRLLCGASLEEYEDELETARRRYDSTAND